MKTQYAALQKNLHEIDSKLARLHALPPDAPPDDRRRLADEIDNRFAFLASLLSAEISSASSSPAPDQSKSRQLQLIADKFGQLHADFARRDHHSEIHSEVDTCPSVEKWDDEGGCGYTAVDGSETCSCSGSCLDDDGEASTEFGTPTAQDSPESGLTMTEIADVWPAFRALNAEDTPEYVVETAEGGGRLSRYGRVMVIGLVTAIMLVMISLSDNSDYGYNFGDRSGYLIPT